MGIVEGFIAFVFIVVVLVCCFVVGAIALGEVQHEKNKTKLIEIHRSALTLKWLEELRELEREKEE